MACKSRNIENKLKLCQDRAIETCYYEHDIVTEELVQTVVLIWMQVAMMIVTVKM